MSCPPQLVRRRCRVHPRCCRLRMLPRNVCCSCFWTFHTALMMLAVPMALNLSLLAFRHYQLCPRRSLSDGFAVVWSRATTIVLSHLRYPIRSHGVILRRWDVVDDDSVRGVRGHNEFASKIRPPIERGVYESVQKVLSRFRRRD